MPKSVKDIWQKLESEWHKKDFQKLVLQNATNILSGHCR